MNSPSAPTRKHKIFQYQSNQSVRNTFVKMCPQRHPSKTHFKNVTCIQGFNVVQYIHVHVCTRQVCNSHTHHLELYCFAPTLLATLANNISKHITCDCIFAGFDLIATQASALPQFSFACFCFCQSLSNDQMSLAQT